MHASDTIVAPATGDAPAVRAIVRSSGPKAWSLARQRGNAELSAGHAINVSLRVSEWQIPATLLCFRGPRSHTGEDVVEYHLPGNPLLVAMLLRDLQRGGARLAKPGEFTARAYFNGKLSLDEAEAVAIAIGATNDGELAAAKRLRAGELAGRVAIVTDGVADLLARCELGIDFTEEDVEVLPRDDAIAGLATLQSQLAALLEETGRVEALQVVPTVVLAGPANAGKSTLMNRLLGRERVVISDTVGTTRDVIAEDLDLPGGRVRLLDVAGLTETSTPLDEAAER
ncbi:MAG: GTPase, partial [Planctomycetota bacterium]